MLVYRYGIPYIYGIRAGLHSSVSSADAAPLHKLLNIHSGRESTRMLLHRRCGAEGGPNLSAHPIYELSPLSNGGTSSTDLDTPHFGTV